MAFRKRSTMGWLPWMWYRDNYVITILNTVSKLSCYLHPNPAPPSPSLLLAPTVILPNTYWMRIWKLNGKERERRWSGWDKKNKKKKKKQWALCIFSNEDNITSARNMEHRHTKTQTDKQNGTPTLCTASDSSLDNSPRRNMSSTLRPCESIHTAMSIVINFSRE